MKTTKCLVPNCNKSPQFRGLCSKHYQVMAKLVQNKKTTRKKLEKAGKLLPSERGNHIQSEAVKWFLS